MTRTGSRRAEKFPSLGEEDPYPVKEYAEFDGAKSAVGVEKWDLEPAGVLVCEGQLASARSRHAVRNNVPKSACSTRRNDTRRTTCSRLLALTCEWLTLWNCDLVEKMQEELAHNGEKRLFVGESWRESQGPREKDRYLYRLM